MHTRIIQKCNRITLELFGHSVCEMEGPEMHVSHVSLVMGYSILGIFERSQVFPLAPK